MGKGEKMTEKNFILKININEMVNIGVKLNKQDCIKIKEELENFIKGAEE